MNAPAFRRRKNEGEKMFDLVQRAVNAFDRETKEGSFPTDVQSYG